MKRGRLALSHEQRTELELLADAERANPESAIRARIVLLSADGRPGTEISKLVGRTKENVSRVRSRFKRQGIAVIVGRPRGAAKRERAIATAQRVLKLASSAPPPGRFRWTTRLLGSELSLSSPTVSKILRAYGSKAAFPHSYKVSRYPVFAQTYSDVAGLYLNAGQKVLVLTASEGRRPPLGVVDLLAALQAELESDTVGPLGRSAGTDLVAFLNTIVLKHPDVALHVVLDNSAEQSSCEMHDWLASNDRIHLHYMPTQRAWTTQVGRLCAGISKRAHPFSAVSARVLRAYVEMRNLPANMGSPAFVWTQPEQPAAEPSKPELTLLH